MRNVEVLTDNIHMDTQTEKVGVNRLSIAGFLFAMLGLMFWLPEILYQLSNVFFPPLDPEMMGFPSVTVAIIAVGVPMLSVALSVFSLFQIKRKKEKGRILITIAILAFVVLLPYIIKYSINSIKSFSS